MTDQKSTDSPGEGMRAPAAATAADRDTDADTKDADAERKGGRLDEITRQADEKAGSDKAKAKQDKQEAREQKKAERAERREAKKSGKDEKDEKDEKEEKKGDKPKGKGAKPGQGLGGEVSAGVSAVRNRVASIVWLIAVLCAVILAIGALLAALSDNINEGNPIVEFINETAEALDGPFGNIITFDGRDDRTKEILVNWGLAALAYLIVGRILDRLIRT